MALIYKVLSRTQWEAAEEKGEFTGAEIDISDGFIHFSTVDQVVETVTKHFAGQADLLLVALEGDELGEQFEVGGIARRSVVSAPLRIASRFGCHFRRAASAWRRWQSHLSRWF